MAIRFPFLRSDGRTIRQIPELRGRRIPCRPDSPRGSLFDKCFKRFSFRQMLQKETRENAPDLIRGGNRSSEKMRPTHKLRVRFNAVESDSRSRASLVSNGKLAPAATHPIHKMAAPTFCCLSSDESARCDWTDRRLPPQQRRASTEQPIRAVVYARPRRGLFRADASIRAQARDIPWIWGKP